MWLKGVDADWQADLGYSIGCRGRSSPGEVSLSGHYKRLRPKKIRFNEQTVDSIRRKEYGYRPGQLNASCMTRAKYASLRETAKVEVVRR